MTNPERANTHSRSARRLGRRMTAAAAAGADSIGRGVRLALVTTGLLLPLSGALAQESAAELAVGQKVRIAVTGAGASTVMVSSLGGRPLVQGVVTAVSADTLVISVDSPAISLRVAAAEVRESWVNVGTASRRRGWLLPGAALGALAGLGWPNSTSGGYAGVINDRQAATEKNVYIGAAVGFLIALVTPLPAHWVQGVFPLRAPPVPARNSP